MANVSPSAKNADTENESASSRLIGGIPFRNIWFLQLYAIFSNSKRFRAHGRTRSRIEENLDDIPSLIAEILIYQVEHHLRRNLSVGYRRFEANLRRVRGRIMLLQTERHMLLKRGQVACRFDELTQDTPRNRYVRAALLHIARRLPPSGAGSAAKCRALARRMELMGVSSAPLTSADRHAAWQKGQNMRHDQAVLMLADLAFNLGLPTEKSGNYRMPKPDDEERWMRQLFEEAVRGVCKMKLEHEGWEVGARKHKWKLEDLHPKFNERMPGMLTDTELKRGKRHIIIDTKFTHIFSNRYEKDKFKTGHLYQIYGYLQAVKAHDGTSPEGILLYVTTKSAPKDEKTYDGTLNGMRIKIASVCLDAPAQTIRDHLNTIIAPALIPDK